MIINIYIKPTLEEDIFQYIVLDSYAGSTPMIINKPQHYDDILKDYLSLNRHIKYDIDNTKIEVVYNIKNILKEFL